MWVLYLAKPVGQNRLLQMIPVLTLAPSILLAQNSLGIVVPVVSPCQCSSRCHTWLWSGSLLAHWSPAVRMRREGKSLSVFLSLVPVAANMQSYTSWKTRTHSKAVFMQACTEGNACPFLTMAVEWQSYEPSLVFHDEHKHKRMCKLHSYVLDTRTRTHRTHRMLLSFTWALKACFSEQLWIQYFAPGMHDWGWTINHPISWCLALPSEPQLPQWATDEREVIKTRQNVFYMPSIIFSFNSDNLNPYLNTEGEQKTIICNDPFQCKIPVLANFVEL